MTKRRNETNEATFSITVAQRDALMTYVFEDVHDEDEEMRPAGMSLSDNGSKLICNDLDRVLSVLESARNSADEDEGSAGRTLANVWRKAVDLMYS